ncbi:hypothetical protein KAJ87_01680 [Candidatus Pacearchaeota archaeon]|nr:hypothetical protein [Candidatus Pacearchaeota archaeon]
MDLIKKSVEVLKSLQLKNGGILATNLDGAYPYIYIRDAIVITKAMNRFGLIKNSEKFYYFVNKFSKLHQYKEIFHRYTKEGLPSVTRKDQHDNTGMLLHGIYDTYLFNKNKDFLKKMWPLIKKCCELILGFSKTGLVKTGTSIHELYRLEQGFEIWSNCACCRGLYDAGKIAEILGYKKENKEWSKKAEQINRNIERKMYNKKTGLFMKNTKYPNVTDISQIAPFYFKIIDSKKILRKTINHLKKVLSHKEGGFRRFKKFEICRDWHWYTGGSGGWVPYTSWMAKFYRELGDKKNYRLYKKWLENIAKKSKGFLPEHIATGEEYKIWKNHEIEFNSRILKGMKKSEELNKKIKENIFYWAVPLGWSHAEYLLLNKNGI